LLWIPSYGQITSEDSVVCLKLNEINYFIQQDTKAKYFEQEDSLITSEYVKCTEIVTNKQSVIKIQEEIIDSQSLFIKSQDTLVTSYNKQLIKCNKKLQRKTKIIIIETSIIAFLIILITL
jgi:hypothetical protein